MGLLPHGTLIEINDRDQNMEGLVGVVLAHDKETDNITFKIVAKDYIGLASQTVKRTNCKVIGYYPLQD